MFDLFVAVAVVDLHKGGVGWCVGLAKREAVHCWGRNLQVRDLLLTRRVSKLPNRNKVLPGMTGSELSILPECYRCTWMFSPGAGKRRGVWIFLE